MTPSAQKDAWASGASYEPFVGRWSRWVAREFLGWLAIPAQARWLDVGCGTGALSQTILAAALPRSVQGLDFSGAFLDYAREQTHDARAGFLRGDAQALPCASGAYDAVVSGLALNFIPRPAQALSEMRRSLRASGTVAVYVWDYAEQMQMLRFFWDAAVALDPAASPLDEGRRFPLCQAETLQQLFEGAGLGAVEVRPIVVPTLFRNFDEYWTPFLGGQGPAPGYVRALAQGQRAALRDRLRASLPTQADGSLALVARAWAARGVK